MPANASSKIRILIVDDMEPVRQGLHTIFQLTEDFQVVGESCNGLEAIRAAASIQPDVVLMDLEMPEMGGLEATRRIKEHDPEIAVVMLTIHGSDEVRDQAMRAGSDVFIEKEAPTEHLLAAIREVCAPSCRNVEGDEA